MSMNPAFTFDDVLLVPSYNHCESRKDVDISSLDKSNKLELKLPVMSANMDTVTEDGMANFMSDKGGIGVLHRFSGESGGSFPGDPAAADIASP